MKLNVECFGYLPQHGIGNKSSVGIEKNDSSSSFFLQTRDSGRWVQVAVGGCRWLQMMNF
ncbi:MAG: hypothetical protein JXQ30_07160 [Spirochaetes bacterium]|nr:hypothetical protein [Spirochaetota bacterium]